MCEAQNAANPDGFASILTMPQHKIFVSKSGSSLNALAMKKELEAKIVETDKGINNIVNLVVSTGSTALTDKLKELETTKTQLQESLTEAERKLSEMLKRL